MSKKFDRDALLAMSSKDVRARYQSMFGEPPRSPNKTWMVNQMEEEHARRREAKKTEKAQILEAPAPRTRGRSAANDAEAIPPAVDLTPVPVVEAAAVQEEATPALGDPSPPRRAGRRARPVEAVIDEPGEASAATALDDGQAPEEEGEERAAATPPTPTITVTATNAAAPARGRFKSMTVDELRTRYEQVVGRTTSSVDKHYLIWKIREAEKGKIRVGPVEPGQRREGALADADKTLPLTLTAPAVEAMDAAWKRTGFPSRMTFMRTAIREALSSRGETDAAALFPEKGVA